MDFLPEQGIAYCLHCNHTTLLTKELPRCALCKKQANAYPHFFNACLELVDSQKGLSIEHLTNIRYFRTRGSEEHGCTNRQITDLALSMTSRVKTLEKALEFKLELPYAFPKLDIVKLCFEHAVTKERAVVFEEPFGPPLYRCEPGGHAYSLAQATGSLLDQSVFLASTGHSNVAPRFFEFLRLIAAIQTLNRLWNALLLQGFYIYLRSAREVRLPAYLHPRSYAGGRR